MSCAACSASVERVTRRLDGVERSDVNLATARMSISYDEARVTPDMITAKVEKAGFGIRLYVPESETTSFDDDKKDIASRKRDLIGALICSALLMYVSMGHMAGLPIPAAFAPDSNPFLFALVQLILSAPVVFWFGRRFFTSEYGLSCGSGKRLFLHFQCYNDRPHIRRRPFTYPLSLF